MDNLDVLQPDLNIDNRIFTIRGLQVMIDRDLALLYCVETRTINQSVKRNIDRFPIEFCFQLSDDEFSYWISQIVISNKEKMGIRKRPYAFTEQGVAMLSGVLRSKTAVQVSLQIMRAFVSMRKFILNNAQIFQRLDLLEIKQLKTDQTLDNVLKALDKKQSQPEKGIFFDGQMFDAYKFISDLIRKATKSIILIDNYIDDKVLTMFSKRNEGVNLTIYTRQLNKHMALDVEKFNQQYEPVEIIEMKQAHDRFLIIDQTELYHIGASLKDLGKKWFAFSKMNSEVLPLLHRLNTPCYTHKISNIK
ncbi:MAG: ORF6N domain-containing protein [Paludibacter sp.]|nr:ORF6N domain-containing protein [Paludibacter sp.]